ncbi:heme NO-binding domain-containing protein [Shimia sp. SDUM112013]|uniref:heme NO-binding domain-containing protein n=1 Tax=Shimia sp. SDUM112013 TaxID=3136160 RepID=UPI0032ED20F5
MHGLMNRAIQSFVRDTYGRDRWVEVTRLAGLDFINFEAMLQYDDALTDAVLDACAQVLGVPRETILEDIGTYLVSHPNVEALRRLLRFGGETFVEFLHSLDELPDRARLAVEDLRLPGMELREHSLNRFSLVCRGSQPGFGHVMMGVLRALADDYGALVFLECRDQPSDQPFETVDITLFESAFAEGRSFDLGAVAG